MISRKSFVAFFLFNDPWKSKVNKDNLIVKRTEHNVIGIDVEMYYFEIVESHQRLEEFVFIAVYEFWNFLTFLHCKLNAIFVEYQIETKRIEHFGTAVKYFTYFAKTVLVDGSADLSSPLIF